jgi:hypothetical protein
MSISCGSTFSFITTSFHEKGVEIINMHLAIHEYVAVNVQHVQVCAFHLHGFSVGASKNGDKVAFSAGAGYMNAKPKCIYM